MKYLVTIIAFVAVLLVACAPQATDQQQPADDMMNDDTQEPMDDTAGDMMNDDTQDTMDDMMDEPSAPAEGEAKASTRGLGLPDKEEAIPFDTIKCDVDTRTLTFTVTNLGEQKWEMNRQVPFNPPKDLASATLTFNNYDVNSRTSYWDGEGNEYFGTDTTLSEACGMESGVLEPGESATCTLTPVPLAEEGSDNILILSAGGFSQTTYFVC